MDYLGFYGKSPNKKPEYRFQLTVNRRGNELVCRESGGFSRSGNSLRMAGGVESFLHTSLLSGPIQRTVRLGDYQIRLQGQGCLGTIE